MFRSLTLKLTLAFALVAFLTAALTAVSIRLTSADRLTQLIVDQQRSSLEQALQDYYAQHGSWEGVNQRWREIQFYSFSTPAAWSTDLPHREERRVVVGRENLLGLADVQGRVIVSVDPSYPTGSQLPAEALRAAAAVNVDGEPVGRILTARQPLGFNPQETLFLQRTSQALFYAGLGALLVALALGVLLARTLTGPLQALTQAAQRMTQGQAAQQVQVSSNDEIGQLAAAFNRMSQEVARVNQQRRQMTADIAHDLRTPLTVISGYVESMREGVLQPTPERFSIIYTEIERLQTMVGDLRTLSLADAGELTLNPQWVSPQTLLDHAAAVFRHQAEQRRVGIEVSAGNDLPRIWADEARMMQVLDNLLANSLRYTPPGGKVALSAQASEDQVKICVQDTGEGISAEDLPYVFSRFHRADKSRHSETGETGLGLAIVKALVETHGGAVSAESAPGKGTAIRLEFPIGGQAE